VKSAANTDRGVKAIGPGVLVVKRALTVSEIIPISAAASSRPRIIPRAEPIITQHGGLAEKDE